MFYDLANAFYDIIRTINGWCAVFLDTLRTPVGELVDGAGWLKEIFIDLVLPNWVENMLLYELIFGVGAFSFVFIAMVRMFLPR